MQQLIDVINLLNYICHFLPPPAAWMVACRFSRSPCPSRHRPRPDSTGGIHKWTEVGSWQSVYGPEKLRLVWANERCGAISMCWPSAVGRLLAKPCKLYFVSINVVPLLIGETRNPKLLFQSISMRHPSDDGHRWVRICGKFQPGSRAWDGGPSRIHPGSYAEWERRRIRFT